MSTQSAPLAACAYDGVYTLIDDLALRVRCVGEALRVERFGHPPRTLAPKGRDAFADGSKRWQFSRGRSGAVVTLIDQRDGRPLAWVKR